MTRLHTSFVLCYHGCSAEVGKRVVNGEPMDASDHAYDWLGPGIYFWESDPARALEWADSDDLTSGKLNLQENSPFLLIIRQLGKFYATTTLEIMVQFVLNPKIVRLSREIFIS